jgi:hypothetical protein
MLPKPRFSHTVQPFAVVLVLVLPVVFTGCQRLDFPPMSVDGGADEVDDAGLGDPDGGAAPEPDAGAPVTLTCEAPFRSVTPDRCTAVWSCAEDGDPAPARDTFELQCSLIASSWVCTCYDRSSGRRVDEGSFETSDGCGPTPRDTTDLTRAHCGFAL